MSTAILHGYGHIAHVTQSLLGIVGISFLHACSFSSVVVSGAWAYSVAELLKPRKTSGYVQAAAQVV